MLLSLKKKVSILLTAVLMVVSTSTVYADGSTSPTDGNTTLATANVTLSSTRNPATTGDPVMFIAEVDGTNGAPTGEVKIMDGSLELGSAQLEAADSGPQKAFIFIPSISRSDADNHQIVAQYNGNGTYAPAESAPFTQYVMDTTVSSTKPSNKVTIKTTESSSIVGNPITLDVVFNSGMPWDVSGSVILMDDGKELARLAVLPVRDTDGNYTGESKASFTTSSLSIGDHSITAKYYGDTRYDLEILTSDALIHNVKAAQNGGGTDASLRKTTTRLVSARNPAAPGEPVTFMADVHWDYVSGSSSEPKGTVTFKDGDSVLGSAKIGEDPTKPGLAVFAVRSLSENDHPITAEYSGDDKFASSISEPLTQSIVKDTLAPSGNTMITTVKSYLNPSKFGNSVTFYVRAETSPFKSGDISGSVILMDGDKELATLAMTPDGVSNGVSKAYYTTSTLEVGDHPITAKYYGDRRLNREDAISKIIVQVVQAGSGGGNPAPGTPNPVPTPNPIPSYDPPYTTPDVPAQPPVPTAPAVPVQEEKPAAESPKTIEEGQNPDDIFRSRVVSADSNVIAGVEVRTADILSKGSSFASVTYGDVAQHWAFPSIEKLTKLGVINGYPNGGFEPNEAITRAEFAAMIERGFVGMASRQVDMNDADFAKFSDIQGHWSSNNLKKLVAVGVLTGYEDGTIRPNQTISRQEMALIVTRVLNANILSVDTSKVEFSDLDGVYAADVIKKTTALGIFEGKTEGNFDPNSGATRAEAIETIIKTYSLSPSIKLALEKLQ